MTRGGLAIDITNRTEQAATRLIQEKSASEARR